ncbi:MAG: hypothetical protein PWP04_585 [Candidatus Atribacteria bacterium]|nr:hypothetical protein [Candidatus Atribacteria bacterium]
MKRFTHKFNFGILVLGLGCTFFLNLILFTPLAEGANSSLGPLSPSLFEGKEGVWQGNLLDDAYLLTNTEDSGSIQYFYVERDQGEYAISVSVKVEGESSGLQGAGILYAFHSEIPSYYAFTLDAEGTVSLSRRDEEGFNQLLGMGTETVRKGNFNTLTIIEQGAAFHLLVNGEEIASVESSRTGEGAVGIVALGTGSFTFSEFKLNQSTGRLPSLD